MHAVWFIAILAAAPAVAQTRSMALEPPFGPEHALASPDGAYSLFGSATAPQLWLEDTPTHRRRLVFEVTLQTLTLAWSPDSAAFIANDRWASDQELAYIYDASTLARVDLRSRILAADPGAARFVPSRDAAPHSYVHAIRWLDSAHVEVRLHGHTDGTWNGTSGKPGDCFDLRYRAGRDGSIAKLSQRVLLVSSNGCRGMD